MDKDVFEYASPLKKLVVFFKASRDKWKAKCRRAKEENKLLKNQVRAVERSREHWREAARTQSARVAELERELKNAAHGVGAA